MKYYISVNQCYIFFCIAKTELRENCMKAILSVSRKLMFLPYHILQYLHKLNSYMCFSSILWMNEIILYSLLRKDDLCWQNECMNVFSKVRINQKLNILKLFFILCEEFYWISCIRENLNLTLVYATIKKNNWEPLV